MKDFAGSSITYYGLAREKMMNKYPWLISVLIILALICTTGLAIYLISDLVSFASNADYKGASIGLDLKGPENGIPSTANDKEKSGNNGANYSLNKSSQAKEQISTNLSKINASLPSSQTAKGVVAVGKSSSSSSQSSVNQKSGNSPVTRHHSSSSSSSSKSTSASSAKKSGDMNNLTNETATINNTQEPVLSIANSSLSLPPIDAANSAITNSSSLSSEGQDGIPTDDVSENSQRAEVAPIAVPTSLPSTTSSFTNPAGNTPPREPVSIIEFKTESTQSPKSEQDISPDNGASSDDTSVSNNVNKAKRSKVATKNIKLKAIKTKSTSPKKSKLTTSSQAAKVKEARDKMKANKDRIEQKVKKKAAQLRSKAA
jgi:hypothetical protein